MQGEITTEPARDYHASEGISASRLRLFADSPYEYWQQVVLGRPAPPQSPQMSYGELLHQWHEYGPTRFWERVVVAPDNVLTAGGAFGKAAASWLADQGDDTIPMSRADQAAMMAQTSQIFENSAAKSLILSASHKEFVVRWKWDDNTKMRARIDGMTDGTMYDIKTTREQRPLSTWWRAVQSYRYDIQSVVYSAAGVSVGLVNQPLQFIVTSTVPPYACHVVTLPVELLSRARTVVQQCLAEIRHRTEWGNWQPDDYGSVTELKCPSFMTNSNREPIGEI